MKRQAKHGDWLARCDVCQRIRYASTLISGIDRQKGLMLCMDDYDGPQEQDRSPRIKDTQHVPFSRPEAYPETQYHAPLGSAPDYFTTTTRPDDLP